jgi:hypothetical protein
VDGERESSHIFLACSQDDYAQEETPIQRGDAETHGGITEEAMGVEERRPASGVDTSSEDPHSELVGLCSECEHARIIRSDRGSVFYLCRLSATDPRFAKYPHLPVLSCPGYKKQEPAEV